MELAQLCLIDCLWPHGLYSPWNSPGQNIGVDSCILLEGIFPTQGLNPGLPHCLWILYQLSRKGSPRILEWVAYPFSRECSRHRNWTMISRFAGGFFTNWATGEAPPPPFSLVIYFIHSSVYIQVFPSGAVVKNPPANAGDARDMGLIPWVRKILQRKK